MTDDLERVLDLADPVRHAVWDALNLGGPMKPAQLRRAAPEAAGSLTAHLRSLEKSGWVSRVGAASSHHSQVWRAERTTMEWETPEGERASWAVSVLERVVAARRERATRVWLSEKRTDAWPGWDAVEVNRDYVLSLTQADLDDLDGEVEVLMERWKARSEQRRESGEGEAIAVTVTAHPFHLPGTV